MNEKEAVEKIMNEDSDLSDINESDADDDDYFHESENSEEESDSSVSPQSTTTSQQHDFSRINDVRRCTWQAANRQPPSFAFEGKQGPTVSVVVNDVENPYQYFKLIFTDGLLDSLVVETNRYASQRLAETTLSPSSEARKWNPVTIKEMEVFFGLVLLTGLVDKKGRMELYWSNNPYLQTPIFSQIMARERFQQISTFLQFNDNTDGPDNRADKLYKIRPVLEALVSKWHEMYSLGEHIAIDEGMLKWGERLSLRVSSKNKPTNYGIKACILTDSVSGYCWNMHVYHQKKKTIQETVQCLLTDKCTGLWHSLYMDNWYNSVQLSVALLEKKIHTVGMLQKLRGEILKITNPQDMTRHEIIARHNGKVMVLAWKDKRIVKAISTKHDSSVAPVSRKKKRGSGAMEEVVKPECIRDFNQYMSGVDHVDQMVPFYPCTDKTLKWTTKLFYYIIELSITNAHILYKSKSRATSMTLHDFQLKLISQMCQLSGDKKMSEKTRKRLKAAIIIQERWRAYLWMRKDKQRFLLLKNSTVIIQACVRSHQARKILEKFQREFRAAVLIQSMWRATLLMRGEKRGFLKMKKACIIIQCTWRCVLARRVFVNIKRWRDSVMLKRMQDAAITIQRKWRAIILAQKFSREFLRKKRSAIIIQSAIRCFLAKKVLLSIREKLRAVNTIQDRWRATILMKNERTLFLQKRYAVIVIQRSTKLFLSKKQLIHLRKRLRAALVIQRKLRATVLMRRDLMIYVEKKIAILKIQTIFRCILAKKAFALKKVEQEAAITVQRRWRATLAMRRDRESFLREKHKAVATQSADWRDFAKIFLEKIKRELNAAKIIQRYWKATLLMKLERTEFLMKKKASVTIQSSFRRFLAKKLFLKLQKEHTSARKIQAKWKATLLMRESKMKFNLKKWAAVIVQCAYRSRLARKRVQKIRERIRAAIIIQARWRATILMNEQLRVYLQNRRHIVMAQRIVRVFLAERLLYKLKTELHAATIIQQKWRGLKKMRVERNQFLRWKFAASVIQRAYKHHLDCKILKENRMKQEAAAKIQAKWKEILLMRKERQKLLEQKEAVILVQSCVRRFLAKKLYRKMIERRETAAKVIQIRWRATLQMRKERKRFLQIKARSNAATTIQRKWRAYIAMRQQRNEYLTARLSAITIQCALRKMLAVRELRYRRSRLHAVLVVQKHRRAWALTRQARIRFLQIMKSIRVIQRFYRARIRERMNSALRALFDAKAYDTVYATLNELYYLSCLSRCCKRISEARGTEVLCQLIASSNCSYHGAFVQKFAISILLHLIKNESTRYDTCRILATNDYTLGCAPMEMLVTVLSRFRDKGSRDQSHVLVFCAACALLIEFCRSGSNTKLLKSKTKSIDMIKYINRETKNKRKLEAKDKVQRGKKEGRGDMPRSRLYHLELAGGREPNFRFLRGIDSLRVPASKSKNGKQEAEKRNPSGGTKKSKPKDPLAEMMFSNLVGDDPVVQNLRKSSVLRKPGFRTNIPIRSPQKVTKPLSPKLERPRAKGVAPCRSDPVSLVSEPSTVTNNFVDVAYDELDHVSCIRCLTHLLAQTTPRCSET